MTARLATIARFHAKARVKEIIRSEGRKVREFSAKDLAILAEDYLNDPVHREELMAKAREWAKDFLTKRHDDKLRPARSGNSTLALSPQPGRRLPCPIMVTAILPLSLNSRSDYPRADCLGQRPIFWLAPVIRAVNLLGTR